MSHVCCHTRVYVHVQVYTDVTRVLPHASVHTCVHPEVHVHKGCASVWHCASVTSRVAWHLAWQHASVQHVYILQVQVCDIVQVCKCVTWHDMTSRMATCKCTTQSVQVYTQSARGLENVYMLYYRSATHCASAKCKSARGLQECVHKVYTSYKWVYTT